MSKNKFQRGFVNHEWNPTIKTKRLTGYERIEITDTTADDRELTRLRSADGNTKSRDVFDFD